MHAVDVLKDGEIVGHLPHTIFPRVYVYFSNVKTIIHAHRCGR